MSKLARLKQKVTKAAEALQAAEGSQKSVQDQLVALTPELAAAAEKVRAAQALSENFAQRRQQLDAQLEAAYKNVDNILADISAVMDDKAHSELATRTQEHLSLRLQEMECQKAHKVATQLVATQRESLARHQAELAEEEAHAPVLAAPPKEAPPPPPSNQPRRACKLPGGRLEKTNNGRAIQARMRELGVKGNPRDYVVLVGYQLFDHAGTWAIGREGPPSPETLERVTLVNKRDLSCFIGAKDAEYFWNRDLGRRASQVRMPTELRLD